MSKDLSGPRTISSRKCSMHRGIDTTFLVQAEVRGHPAHDAARAKLDELLKAGDTLVIAPQVLAEYIHIVTDPRRFLRSAPHRPGDVEGGVLVERPGSRARVPRGRERPALLHVDHGAPARAEASPGHAAGSHLLFERGALHPLLERPGLRGVRMLRGGRPLIA